MFLKECKKVIMSVTFLIFTGVMLLVFATQYGNSLFERHEEPQPGLSEYTAYGYAENDDDTAVMQETTEKLIQSFQSNEYSAYPIGFYRLVRLNDAKQKEMAELLSRLTGIPAGDVPETNFNIPYNTLGENGGLIQVMPEDGTDIPVISDRMNYAEFEELMQEADSLIGGGSAFESAAIRQNSRKPVNYEQALEAYNAFIEENITPGYARLFCDYLGIFASLFPAFVAIYQTLKDKNTGIRDMIYTRKVSSLRLTFTRYFAAVLSCSLVMLVLAVVATICHAVSYAGMSLDYLAFFKYTLIWVLPSIMASAAIGAFTAEWTDSPIGILLMAAYWFMDLNSGGGLLAGSAGSFSLIPRHNSELYTQLFADNFTTFLSNRILFTIASLILICMTALILEQKRTGRWIRFEGGIRKIFAGRKSQPEV